MPASNSAIRVGLDMGGNDIKFGATDLSAQQILTPNLVKRPSMTQEGPARTVAQMIDGLTAVLGDLKRNWSDVADIAVTVPCPCSPTGSIIEATNLGTPETKEMWKVPFGELLAAAVAKVSGAAIPVFACNDANAAGQDDDFARFGSDVSPHTSVFVTTGTGLGGAILINGSVHYGRGQAGELGHVKVAIPHKHAARFAADVAPVCGCGGIDCVETRASLKGCIRRVQWAVTDAGAAAIKADVESRGQTFNPDTLAKLRELCKQDPRLAAYNVRTFADAGDAIGRWLLEDWAVMIGALFASLSPVLHPDLFIIGGGMTEVSPALRDWFIGVVRDTYNDTNAQAAFDSDDTNCRIVWSVTRDQGWRGAILMAMRAKAS